LVWSINKSLAIFVCKIRYGDDVAHTEAKAHRGLERGAVIVA